MILLLAGCADGGSSANVYTVFSPEGKWESSYDSYTITKTSVTYEDGFGNMFKGDIAKSVAFSDNAGVLIIKITDVAGTFYPYTVNYYGGVYYKEGLKTSIKIANALNSNWSVVETTTLQQAQTLFTVDNVGNHVGMWGSYTK
jgi:hypothetical protein